nr:pectinesterase family protein [Agromyces seonyuensis]
MTTSNSTLVTTTTALKITDAGAVAGTKYWYAVASVDTSGNASGLSSTKSITATDAAKPSTPSSLKATAGTAGIALDWKDNSELDLAGYTVSRGTSSSGPWTVVSSLSVNSAYTDTTAPVGVKSYYRVTARDLTGNLSGYASANATRTGTLPPAQAPGAPTGFAAKLSSNVPVLSWGAATGATSYTLSRATSPEGPFTTVASGLTGTSYTDGAAPARATAYYSLVAVNAVGASTAVTASIEVPGDTTPPANPRSPKATVIVAGGIGVSWAANTEKDLAGYLVLKRDKERGGYFPYLGTAEAPYPLTSFTDPTVIEGTVGYFRIEAVDASGNVSEGYVAVTANHPNVKPATPSSLKVTQDPIAGLALAWKAPADLDLAGYTVYRSTGSTNAWALLDNIVLGTGPATPAYRDTSAPKGVVSYYRVVAVDAVGNVSSYSSTVSGTSLTTPIPIVYEETVLTVGADKQFQTIGAALAEIPRNNLRRYRIDVDPGTYDEVVRIRSGYVTVHGTGASPADTVIASAQASGSPDPAEPGETLGTAGSAVVRIDDTANDVTLRNLTVANTFDEAAHPEIESQQAVALRVEGDRFVGDTIRLIGNQDTLLADTPRPTARVRQYYVDSYIEGDVDFVFGAANAVFDRVTFRALDRSKANNGYVTAASSDEGSKYGFLIWDSKIVSDAADGTVNLGRPWHPSADPDAQGSVVVMHTWLPSAIDTAAPWDEMSSRNSAGESVLFPWTTGRFFEYGNVGPGAAVNELRPQLAEKEAAKLTPAVQLAGSDGWNPVVAAADVAPATPTGLVAATDTRLVNLAWADDESAAVVGWNVYRADGDGAFAKIASTDAAEYADSTVATGGAYRYLVTAATRSGLESAPSGELAVTVAVAEHAADFIVDPAAAPSATTFPTLAAALAAVPAGTSVDPTVIELVPGRYAGEYVTVTKPNTIIRGAGSDASAVVITGDRASGTPTGEVVDGVAQTYGTSGSASMVITANDVTLEGLTVENAYVEGTYSNGQAVALRTTGDRLRLEGVRLIGNQDTFYANSAGRTVAARVYVHDSFIEGDVDFVFGRATVVMDASTLHIVDHGTNPNGAVTAASTNVANPFGFLITGSRIIGDAPDGSQNLGRPWQPGISQPDGTSVRDVDAIAQVVVRDTWLGPVVSQTAWVDMVNSGVNTTWQSARFAEYRNAGPGAAPESATRAQLTDEAAAGYTAEAYLAGADGWNPVSERATDAAPAAVAGLTATGGDRRIGLDWADGAEVDVVGYRVYAGDTADFVADDASLVAEVASSDFLEEFESNGLTRYYRVVALDLAGNASAASDAVGATTAVPPLVADLTVAADGTGDFTTVQAALAAIQAGTASAPKVVVVEPGTYREVVNSAKPYVWLVGATGDPRDVVITFDNANGTAASAATCPFVTTTATCGTGGSATATFSGGGVQVRDLTIANTFDRAANPTITNTQAVALRALGDRQVFSNVRLLGHQDTLNADASGNISADGSGYPRQYYVDSFIEGDVDFVFGRANAVFERVSFHALERNGGAVFAPSTASKAKGYLVVDSRFTSDGDGFALGRPWRGWSDGGNDDSRGQVVIRDSAIGAGFVTAHPWIDMSPLVWTDGRFAEYRNTGAGVAASADRPQLTAEQTESATPQAWLAGSDGWAPFLPADATAPRTPSGLTASAASGKVSLAWDGATESDVVGYRVYRDGALLTTTEAARFADETVIDGNAYAYAVQAVDRAGRASAISSSVSATPTLRVDATVAADGSGDYTSLAAAITAASTGWVIQVEPGTYAGTTVVSKAVTIVGTGDPSAVVLTNATTTATLSITAAGVTVRGLTVENASASGTAPALSMTADKTLVQDAVISSTANRTVFADTTSNLTAARQLITGSTIIGGNDVFLGRATLVVHDSVIRPRTNGTVLTPSTAENQRGFLLIDSTIDTGAGANVQLGRPYRAWADTITPKSVGQAVVRGTELGAGVKTAQPWGTGPAQEPWTLGRLAEYGNTGAGAGTGPTRPQLSAIDSLDATAAAWLGAATWYPSIADPATPADIEAPAAVTGLVAAPLDRGAALTWNASASADVAGYRVHRVTGTTANTAASTLVATVTEPAFTDAGLANASTYTWAIVPVDGAGNLGQAVIVTGVPDDGLAPAAPTGVSAAGAFTRVTVSWAANAEPDVVGYAVLRDGERIGTTDAATRTFGDAGLVNGTGYAYSVVAIDASGLESAPSAPVTGTPVDGDGTPPSAPTALSTVLGKGSVTVRWTGSPDVDVAQYAVRRGGATLGTVPAGTTSFTDTTAPVDVAATYTVVAVDAAGNPSSPATPVTVIPIAVDVVVAADGTGDVTTLQAAFGAAGRSILVMPGTYTGTSSHTNGQRITGATGDPADVVLTAPGAGPTLTIAGADWRIEDVTVQSVPATAGGAATAVAVKNGDRQVFEHVRILGDQKAFTVSTANTSTYSRIYVHDSYLEGGSDLVVGRAVTVIDDSRIHVLRGGPSILESSIMPGSAFGFLVNDSVITADASAAAGSVYLGRPYPETTGVSPQVVVRGTELPAAINATQPWKDWNAATPWTLGRFFEFGNTGPGAGLGANRPQLTDTTAADFTVEKYLAGTDGWNPAR